MPFVCRSHQVAYDSSRQMWGHYLHSHPGEPRPPKESLWLDALPPGIILKGPALASGRPPVAPPEVSATVAPETTGEEAAPITAAQPPRPSTPYREAPSATTILDTILKRFPGLPGAVHAEIMDWAEQRGTPLAPMEVAHLLEQMAGVPRGAANIIPQKYAFALDKSAREGNAEVRMLLTNWGTAGVAPSGPGSIGSPWPMPTWPSAGMPFGNTQAPGWPGMGQPMWAPWAQGPQQRPETEPTEDPRLAQLEAQMAELRQSNEALKEALRQKEEAAREERHRQEIEAMERRSNEQIAAVQAALNELKQALAGPDRSGKMDVLEAKLDQLRDEKHAAQMSALETRLEDLKSRPPPVTGSTEMDVIRETASGVVDAMKGAGQDLKTIYLAGVAKTNLVPGRRTAEERARLGGALVQNLDRHDEAMANADSLFQVGT